MRAVTSKVLVRLLARDNGGQVADTEAFGAHGAWVPTLAVVEAMRILEAIYDWPPARQSICLEMQLDHGDLVIQDAEVVSAAVPMGTFDRKLGGRVLRALGRKVGRGGEYE